ncbi:hypothetical protein FRC10_001257, partial [Ceratobasidium sp. 414]
MIPLRAESSTVSLPPRERTLAKRRAKAIKLGLSPSVACKSPAKRARKRAKAPVPPTLAATCQRRAAANVAYIEQPDGYHVKQVVRRVTPGPAPPVPYLPGEEDLPHSDAESDGSDATELQLVSSNNLGELSTTFDVGLEADETPTEPDIDLVDYDAEGEDEDEDIHMQATQLTNPFADASNDDIQALFGGLNNLHFGDSPATNDGDLPGFADAHSRPIPDRWAAHAQYLFGSISDEPQHRGRYSNPAPETLHRNHSVLRSGALTPDQQSVASPMEYSVLKDIICDNPWPEDRDAFLRAAQEYATNVTGISGADVYTHRFLDTIFYRTSGNRGNSLSKIEVMMEQEFTITTVDKPELYQLMNKDQFLYPTADWDPSQYFCVGALGAALEIILFKSAKTVGLVFMEEFCQPDDAEKCAHWHRKLRDRTAHKGVSPGAIAFAATQMYWALEKLYLGTNIHFEEGHFRGIWERYVRALIKLPHLGQLRIDLLDRLKEYYMDHWPSDERDEDDNSFLA